MIGSSSGSVSSLNSGYWGSDSGSTSCVRVGSSISTSCPSKLWKDADPDVVPGLDGGLENGFDGGFRFRPTCEYEVNVVGLLFQ